MKRRAYLSTITTVGGGVLAGCMGNANSDGQNTKGKSDGDNQTGSNNGNAENSQGGNTSTATASDKVEISNTEFFIRKLDEDTILPVITGLITNTSNEPLRAPSVDIIFYDANNKILDENNSQIPFLNPGVSWSIYQPTAIPSREKVVRGEIIPRKIETFHKELGKSEGLKITKHSLKMTDSGVAKIPGTLKNVGSHRIEFATVLATFKMKNGHVLGGKMDTEARFGPGQTWDFDIRYYIFYTEERAKSLSDYTLYAYEGPFNE